MSKKTKQLVMNDEADNVTVSEDYVEDESLGSNNDNKAMIRKTFDQVTHKGKLVGKGISQHTIGFNAFPSLTNRKYL